MDYFKNIASAASTIFEGLTITFSHLFRKPITVQYPDKIDVPLQEMLFCRYRGFLNVDTKICTGCTICMTSCPIQCIDIEIIKNTPSPQPSPSCQTTGGQARGEGEGGGGLPTRVMTKFNIDISKCMFCGLCVEACPTGAISFTREFEGASYDINDLTFKFVEEGKSVIPYKKGAA